MKEAIARLVKECEENAKIPCIVTFRPNWEGGQDDGDEETLTEMFMGRISSGADVRGLRVVNDRAVRKGETRGWRC